MEGGGRGRGEAQEGGLGAATGAGAAAAGGLGAGVLREHDRAPPGLPENKRHGSRLFACSY